MPTTIHTKIKLFRTSKGLSQPEFCKMIEVPMRTYLRYENGTRGIPSIVLEKIKNKFNLPGYDFLLGDGFAVEETRILATNFLSLDQQGRQLLLLQSSLMRAEYNRRGC